jgi:GNAT superfamily N-acetyltransferase
MQAVVVTYDEKYKEVFRALNLAWIEKYFRIEPKDLEQVNAPEQCLNDGGQVFFVVADGQAVGTCALYKIGRDRYELAKMAVDPAFRGHGFGDLLMVAAEDWARREQATEILILSNTLLDPAIRLYHKHGFKTVHLGPHKDYERANIEMIKTLR